MGRENPYGQRAYRRWKRHMGTEHARNASSLEVSVEGVMQDQGVAWSKLDCLKPSFLALSPRVDEYWLKRPQKRLARVSCSDSCTL
jgi:hypothetical protein